MPHNLTDVDAFTSPVVVPDGTDSHTILAEYIAAVGQALANRTRNLKNITAKLDDPNVFTDTNKFNLGPIEVDDDDATHAALVVRNTAADDSHAAGANKWKAELGFNIAGGVGYVNVYAGAAAGEAQFIIALNAVWDPTSQLWAKDDTGSHSLALLFDQDLGMRISRKAAGVGTWATWPTTLGDLALPGALTAGTLATTGDVTAGDDLIANDSVTAGGDVTGTGNFTAGGNVNAGAEFLYSSSPARSVVYSMAGGSQDAAASNWDYNAATETITTGGRGTHAEWVIPLDLPDGAQITSIDCQANKNTSNILFRLIRQTQTDWGASPAAATTNIITNVTASAAGLKTVSVSAGSYVVDNATETYSIIVICATNSAAGDIAERFKVNFLDPGPRNY